MYAPVGAAFGPGFRVPRRAVSSPRPFDWSKALNAQLESQAVACPDCDLLQAIAPLPPGAKATCPRCGSVIARQPSAPEDVPLALSLTAAVAFVIANVEPLMDLSAVGRYASTTVAGGAYEMWMQGEAITGALIAFCAVLAPGGYILFMLAVLLAARRSPVPRWVTELLRWASHFHVWSMLEVMMLGILVSLVKISELATVETGIGMYAIFALMILFPAIAVSFDARDLWRRVEWADGETPAAGFAAIPVADPAR